MSVISQAVQRISLGMGKDSRWGQFLIYSCVFLWPFIYFFPLVFPVQGRITRLGSDFVPLNYLYKHYLLDSLSHFRIPLWSPSEAAGYPFYSSPYTQTLYPLNIPLAILYRLCGGYSVLEHQRYTVLGVSIFAVGLLLWLRQFKLNPRAVLFAVMLMPVSFKIAEILRLPNAVHTMAWYPWILYSITKVSYSLSIRNAVGNGLLLSFSLICFLSGGWLYYHYYAFFLLVPYVLIFFVGPLRKRFFGSDRPKLLLATVTLGLSGLISVLVCSPYLLKVIGLMNQTTDRAGGSLAFSNGGAFSFQGTVGSLVFPPAARAEGWYYFGIIGLLLVITYFWGWFKAPHSESSKVNATERTSQYWYHSHSIKFFFLLWIAVISFVSYGATSPLWIILWKYMPFFSNFRQWGRLNIILVPIIGLLIAIAYTDFEEFLSKRSNRQEFWRVFSILVCSYLAIVFVQFILFRDHRYDYYWTTFMPHPLINESTFIKLGFLAFIILAVLTLLSGRGWLRSSRGLTVILVGLLFYSVADIRTGKLNIWMWTELESTVVPDREELNVPLRNMQSLTLPRYDMPNAISPGAYYSVGTQENWYFERYNRFLDVSQWELDARRRLLGVTGSQRLFFSQSIIDPTISEFLADADQFKDFEYDIVSYNGDRLVTDIVAPTDGYLSFIDNWDPDWEASIDSQAVPIEVLFGTFKSVHVSAGPHRVVFAYRPRFFLWSP